MRQIKGSHLSVYIKTHIWLVLSVSISLLIIVIIAIGYVLSDRYWTAYTQATDSYYQSTEQKTRSGIIDKSKSVLLSLQPVYDDAGQICKPSTLYGWQTINGSIKAKQDHCNGNASKLQAFGQKLRVVTIHLDSQQQIADMIKSIEVSEQVTEDGFAKTIEAWKGLGLKLEALKVPDTMNETKSIARERVRVMTTGWQELQSAHAAKNRASYEVAIAKITSEYSTLEQIASTSTTDLEKLANALQLSFDESFS